MRAARKPLRSRRGLSLRVVLVLMLVFGPLLATEGILRVLVETERLPEAAAHSTPFDVVWSNLRSGPVPDVLLVGDSIMESGINPDTLANELGTVAKRHVSVFDGAVPGSKPDLTLAFVQQLEVERRLPRVVVIGLEPGALENRTVFRGFFLKTPFGRISTGCRFEQGYDAIVNCRAEQLSVLWRWRGRIGPVVEAIQHRLPRTIASPKSLLGSNGFRSSTGSTDVALQAEIDTLTKNGRLPAFQMPPGFEADFVRLVQFLRRHEVTVMAVSFPRFPPLAQRLEILHPGWEASYQSALGRLEQAAKIMIATPSVAGWFTAADAHDATHLSTQGAEHFTSELLQVHGFAQKMVKALTP
jgi:hypothetical protein